MERHAFSANQSLSALEKELLKREKEILNQKIDSDDFDCRKLAEGIPEEELMDYSEEKAVTIFEKQDPRENKKQMDIEVVKPQESLSANVENGVNEDDIGDDSSDDDESITSDSNDVANVDKNADDVTRLKAQGDECTKNGRWGEAVKLYTDALACQKLAPLFGNRSLCYQKLEQFEKAEEDCSCALELDWKYKKMYKRRAAMRLRRRNYYGCAADLQNLMILSAKDASKDPLVAEQYNVLLPLARLDNTGGCGGAVAKSTNDKIKQLEKETLSKICEMNETVAVDLLNRGEPRDAVEYLLMAMMAMPTSARLYCLRASAHVKRGDFKLAEADLTTATQLEPNNSRFLRLRAEVRRKNGDVTGAAQDERTAKQLSSSGVSVSSPSNTKAVSSPLPSKLSSVFIPSQPSNSTAPSATGVSKPSASLFSEAFAPQPKSSVVNSSVELPAKRVGQNPSDVPLSKLIRLSVEDVYSSSTGELFDLGQLPDPIKKILS